MFLFQKTLNGLLAQHIGYPEWADFTNYQTSTHTWTGNSSNWPTISLTGEIKLQNWNTTTTGNNTWTITTP